MSGGLMVFGLRLALLAAEMVLRIPELFRRRNREPYGEVDH
ncbi:hypothetical protein [Krasilnikovia sp. MM14-A1259]